jgi:hypothetical protein
VRQWISHLNSYDKKPILTTDTPVILMWRPETHSLTAQDPRAASSNDNSELPRQAMVTLLDQTYTLHFSGAGQPDDRLHGCPTTLVIPRD